jgi:hypothetical protein
MTGSAKALAAQTGADGNARPAGIAISKKHLTLQGAILAFRQEMTISC